MLICKPVLFKLHLLFCFKETSCVVNTFILRCMDVTLMVDVCSFILFWWKIEINDNSYEKVQLYYFGRRLKSMIILMRRSNFSFYNCSFSLLSVSAHKGKKC